MSALSKDIEMDIVRIAARPNHLTNSDLLQEVLAYCWEQLTWRKTDAELTALLDGLRLDDQ